VKPVDILIVNWNGRHFCETLIPELLALPCFEELISSIVIVDNGSVDGSVDYISTNFPFIKLLALGENRGYAKGNNVGLNVCDAEFVLLLNNDTSINDPKFLRKLVDSARSEPDCGAVSPALYLPSGRLQTGAGGFDRGLVSYISYFLFLGKLLPRVSKPFYFDQHMFRNCSSPVHLDWVSGAAMLVRTGALKQVGGVPEDYFMYSEDIKLCRNLREMGLKINYLPSSTLIHMHGGSEDARGVKTRWIESTLTEYGLHVGTSKRWLAKTIFYVGFMLRASAYGIRWVLAKRESDRVSASKMLIYSKAALAFKVRRGGN
jgi:GT2 family glycosyltransferase